MRKSIKFAHDKTAGIYKVISVKNSTEFDPGDILNRTQVEELCQNKVWDVTIVKYHEEEKA